VPENEPFGYGSAFGAVFMICLVNSVVYSIFFYAYLAFINAGFTDMIVQDTMDKMQAKGISGTQLDNMEKGIRFMSSPAMQSASSLIGGVIFGLILAAIIAAFMKRPAPPVAIRQV
jgi:hypothetical protein